MGGLNESRIVFCDYAFWFNGGEWWSLWGVIMILVIRGDVVVCFGWIGLVWGSGGRCGLTCGYWGSNGLLIWCCVVGGCWFVRNWLDFSVIGGRVVGDVVLLVSSFGDWLGDVGWWSWYWIGIGVIVIVIVYWEIMGVSVSLWFEWGLMFDCIIVVILRNIEIMVVPLYELVWLGMEMEWGGVGFVWSWFVVHVWLWFLGVHLFDTCFGLVCGCA